MTQTSPTYRIKKPALLEQIRHDNHAIIEASAGTGKTYTIEHLVVDLLLKNPQLRIPQILIVTFTERATFELGARIRQLLQAVVDADEKLLAGPDEPAWEIGLNERRTLEKALSSFDLAAIHTIHGFCHRVLTENAFQNHRPFEQEHTGFDQLFERVFKDALRREFAYRPEFRGYLAAWMEQNNNGIASLQKLLATCVRARGEIRPEFDEAGLRQAVDAFEAFERDEIVAKLKAELKEEKVHGGTVNAVVKRIDVLLAGLERYRESGDLVDVMGPCGAKGQLDYMQEKLALFEFGGEVGQCVREVYETLTSLEAAIATQFTPVLQRMLREFKDESGQFVFDDMLSLVWESLESARGDSLVQSLRQRYQYALIDEFQDTDELQWQIFKRIFHESNGANIFYLIGDPKQAIYSFRGADVYTYLHAHKVVKDGGGDLLQLDKNYRSSANVIDAYNHVFDQSSERPFFSGDITYDSPVGCGLKEREVCDADGLPATAIKLVQMVDEDLKVDRLREGIAAYFAAEIREILFGDKMLFCRDSPDDAATPVGARDIFVLTRSKKEGRIIAEFLRHEGVPYAFFKQDGLFQTAEALHIYDLLGGVANPRDRSARLKAWLTPFFGLTLEELEETDSFTENDRPLGDLLHWNELAEARQFQLLFSSILSRTGRLRAEIFSGVSERELTNYLHLFEILLDEATRDRCPLDDLIVRLQSYILGEGEPEGEDGNVQRLETDRDAVQIMTMHKSKGLEAEIVFVFGGFTARAAHSVYSFHGDDGEPILYLGTPPEEMREQWAREQAEEDQRLLYVALTRAKSQIYLPYVGFENEAPKKKKTAKKGDEEAAKPRDYTVGGAYAPILTRLDAVVAELSASDAEVGRLFSLEKIEYARTLRVTDAAARQRALADWQPPAELPMPLNDDAEFRPLRGRRPIVTSYSRIKNTVGRLGPHQGEVPAIRVERAGKSSFLENDLVADGGEEAVAILAPDELPGGKRAGVFLHELLEQADLARARECAKLSEWMEDADVDATFRRTMRTYGVEEEYLGFCKKLVWRAIKTPLRLDAGQEGAESAIPCVAQSDKVLRELEFVYPIPERPSEQAVERGFIKGFVDLIFENDSKIYFADWKSDILTDYGPQSLNQRVAESYGIQATIYILAMVKFLEITDQKAYDERFGGYFYLFVRGMGASENPAAGVYYRRPTWEDILQDEEILAANI